MTVIPADDTTNRGTLEIVCFRIRGLSKIRVHLHRTVYIDTCDACSLMPQYVKQTAYGIGIEVIRAVFRNVIRHMEGYIVACYSIDFRHIVRQRPAVCVAVIPPADAPVAIAVGGEVNGRAFKGY